MAKSVVTITEAKDMDYQTEYVSLPKDYGKPSYFERREVASIIDTVHKNLKDLDQRIHFTEAIKGKKVIIKPNLVIVLYKLGYKEDQYPETTDPRVFDAVVAFIKKYTDKIVIVESSGRGMPTRASFKIAGYDRIANYHNAELIALEEQPLDRYMLPKAQLMKEIYIPRIFSEVVTGDAFYISVPKMKTNLYTGVTLGFKNAMGTIPYNLRQRNHNHGINKKLVDMLFLFKPGLVVIDGIVGGEGNTPAPVDPVKSHVIVSGNNPVETDWVATEMMGFDPKDIELMTEAKAMGFGDDQVEVVGQKKITHFRKADQSLISERMQEIYPNVKVFIGHTKTTAPVIERLDKVTPELVRDIEKACLGGCVASLRSAFEDAYYQGKDTSFKASIVIGAGVPVGGRMHYFDRDGYPYTVDDITSSGGHILNFGSCTKDNFQGKCSMSAYGCMPKPGDSLKAVHKMTGKPNFVLSLRNKQLMKTLKSLMESRRARLKLLEAGEWTDCPPTYFKDQIYEIPELGGKELEKDFIPWPLPKLDKETKRILKSEIKTMY